MSAVNLQHGEVRVRIVAHQIRRHFAAVGKGRADFRRGLFRVVGHHVAVGDRAPSGVNRNPEAEPPRCFAVTFAAQAYCATAGATRPQRRSPPGCKHRQRRVQAAPRRSAPPGDIAGCRHRERATPSHHSVRAAHLFALDVGKAHPPASAAPHTSREAAVSEKSGCDSGVRRAPARRGLVKTSRRPAPCRLPESSGFQGRLSARKKPCARALLVSSRLLMPFAAATAAAPARFRSTPTISAVW